MPKTALPFARISTILVLSMLLVVLFSCPCFAQVGMPSPSSCDYGQGYDLCTIGKMQCDVSGSTYPEGGYVVPQCDGSFEVAFTHWLEIGKFWYTQDYCSPGCCNAGAPTYPIEIVIAGDHTEQYGFYTLHYIDYEVHFECGEPGPDECSGGMTCSGHKVPIRAWPSCWYTCHCPNENLCLEMTPGEWRVPEGDECGDCVCRDYPCGGRKIRNPGTCVCECSSEDRAACVGDRNKFNEDSCQCECGDYANSVQGRLTPFYNSSSIGLEININKRVGGSTGWMPFDSTGGDCWFYSYQMKLVDADGNILDKGKHLGAMDWVWCTPYGTDNVIDGNTECYTGGAPYLEFGTYSGVEMDCWNMTCNFDDYGWMKVDIISPELTLNNQGFNVDTGWGYETYSFLWGKRNEVLKGSGASLIQQVEKRGNRLRLSRGGYEKRD